MTQFVVISCCRPVQKRWLVHIRLNVVQVNVDNLFFFKKRIDFNSQRLEVTSSLAAARVTNKNKYWNNILITLTKSEYNWGFWKEIPKWVGVSYMDLNRWWGVGCGPEAFPNQLDNMHILCHTAVWQYAHSGAFNMHKGYNTHTFDLAIWRTWPWNPCPQMPCHPFWANETHSSRQKD